MFGHKYFYKSGDKIYFKRSSQGPFYEIGVTEEIALKELVHWQNRRMALLFVSFASALVIAILGFSAFLDLSWFIGLLVGFFLVVFGFSPLTLMVLIHLKFQKRVREILGQRRAVETIGKSGKVEPLSLDHTREAKLALLFLLGVGFATLSFYMLFLLPEEMEFKRIVIWTLNLGTGLLLAFLGLYGLLTKGTTGKGLLEKDKSSKSVSRGASGGLR